MVGDNGSAEEPGFSGPDGRDVGTPDPTQRHDFGGFALDLVVGMPHSPLASASETSGEAASVRFDSRKA